MKLLLVLLLAAQLSVPGVWSNSSAVVPTSTSTSAVQKKYEIELSRFGIRNDGTRPVETTKGINNALKWAGKNGKTVTSLPAGTYLIDKNSRINMVSNMTFELPKNAVLQKETNGKEHYQLMYIGYGVNNVTLKGGVYKGDKDKHDYSKKDHQFSAGTHESGYGIATEGAVNLTIDGVKATHFTGDGLVLGGHGTMVQDLYANHFEQGEFDGKGKKVANAKKIRTKNPLTFTNAIFKSEREFELSNPIKLPAGFDIYFYKANGTFLQKMAGKRVRDIFTIPEGAAKFHLVFNQSATKGAYVEFWNRVVTQDVVIKNSEFAFNRRQGITVGGADNVWITGSSFHDMKGTMPQSGIDVEGGFGENGHRNSNITIKGNKFYNNASYDVILYDGRDATVEDNHLASKGVIGLAVSEPFKGALIKNNHFDGTRIIAYHDVDFLNNKMNDSFTTLEGPNITIDGMEFTDSLFAVNSKVPFGIAVSNVTIKNNKISNSGLSLAGKPVHIKNLTINGLSTLRSFSGISAEGSIFDNLKVIGFNTTYGLSLPPGTYNNCVFEGAEGGKFGIIHAASAGKYVFDGCSFKSASTLIANFVGEHPKLDLTIKNSTFEVLGNTQAISIQAAKSVLLENNTINAGKLTNTSLELIRINDYWKRKEKHDILKAIIRGNTITSNNAAIGISTINAGIGAPPYTIENNTLHKAKLSLKSNDAVSNNTLK
ncbi:right-handed parallel beta-helix repeat-containing protein [Paenibacillus alkaliterrae]|uniref:right-handed parallel beta-helix repeat-containing protein n=1 Tax=Paenibacillus alkaliterrae TaxID=320909 RepID=UPI001F3B5D1A|nr:right-handed parallel beta-helix repeat-containing protein [Paenibacillus alkaliterrae]MCF2937189.1 right-handed parallel beta-helix repeat-containing protein [Paenibacillus alkaliterrae]